MTIILVTATAALAAARATRLPSVPLLLLAGVAMAMTGIVGETAFVDEGVRLGVTFLVFAAGVELNPTRVGKQRYAALKVGVAQFSFMALIGLAVALGIGFEWLEALYVALALSCSSTLVVLRLLQQRRQLFEPFGRLVLGVLLLQDLLIIFLISAVSRAEAGWPAAAMGIAATLAMVLLAWVCMKWITPRVLLREGMDEETLLLVVVAILFAFVGISQLEVVDLPMAAGAFLGGMALSSFPVQGVVRGQLASLTDFFAAVFFVSLGASLTLPGARELTIALMFVVVVLGVTPPVVYFVARRAGVGARSAVESGLLLAQTSEFSLIVVAIVGMELGHISEGVSAIIALVTAVTMMITPFIATDWLTWKSVRWMQLGRRPSVEPLPEHHILILGCGENGMRLLRRLLAHGNRIAVVDDDQAVIDRVRAMQVTAIRGDGADPSVLAAAGARQARLIISTLRRANDNEKLLAYVRGVPVLVRVFAPEEARRLEAAGGQPMVEAEVAAEDFFRWFDTRFGGASDADEGGRPQSAV